MPVPTPPIERDIIRFQIAKGDLIRNAVLKLGEKAVELSDSRSKVGLLSVADEFTNIDHEDACNRALR